MIDRRLRGAALVAGLLLGATLLGAASAVRAQPGTVPAALPAYTRTGADTCLVCHLTWAAALEIFKTPHAVPSDPRGPFGDGQLQCEACHGPGSVHAGRTPAGETRPPVPFFAPASAGSIEAQNGQCLACHSDDAGTGWPLGAHAAVEVRCVDCHKMHAARDPVLAAPTETDVCYQCHEQQQTAMRQAYRHPLSDGGMSCTSCHSVHGTDGGRALARQTVNDTCFQCHAEKRGPFLWEHAPVTEDCTICHAPHGSNQPAMLAQRGPFLCQTCHAEATHQGLPQTPAGLPAGAPSVFLLAGNCTNCHVQVHGSNHPSGSRLMR